MYSPSFVLGISFSFLNEDNLSKLVTAIPIQQQDASAKHHFEFRGTKTNFD
jgi:hypothetical protein